MKFKQLTHMKFQHPAYPYMFHLFLQEPNEIFTFNFPFDKWENIGLENYNDLFKFIELRVLKQRTKKTMEKIHTTKSLFF